MNLAEKINELAKDLNENKQIEVIDFMEFLKQKQLKEEMNIMEEIFIENAEAMKELSKWWDG